MIIKISIRSIKQCQYSACARVNHSKSKQSVLSHVFSLNRNPEINHTQTPLTAVDWFSFPFATSFDRDIFPVNQTEVETFSICFSFGRGHLGPVVTSTFSAAPPFFPGMLVEIFNRPQTFSRCTESKRNVESARRFVRGWLWDRGEILWIRDANSLLVTIAFPSFRIVRELPLARNWKLQLRLKTSVRRSIQIEHKCSTSLLDLSLNALRGWQRACRFRIPPCSSLFPTITWNLRHVQPKLRLQRIECFSVLE